MRSMRLLAVVVASGVALTLVLGALAWTLGASSSKAQEQRTYGPGWLNMAHVGATQPVAQALSGIESNVGVVYYLNPETGAWLRYVPAKPEVSNLTTMEFGQSYLLLLTAPTAMTVPTEQAFLATPTSCPDCGQWQSAAQQCLADYDQCVTEFGDCVDSLTACLALESQSPDLTEVCQLINDLRWDNQTLQGAWGFLLVTLMFSDDISVSDWGPTDLAIGDVNWTVSQLQSWTILNCH